MSFFILHTCRLNLAYVPPSRHTVAEVADERHYEITCTAPKRPKTGVSVLYISADGPPVSSSTETHEELDASIDTYRKMPVLSQDGDPL